MSDEHRCNDCNCELTDVGHENGGWICQLCEARDEIARLRGLLKEAGEALQTFGSHDPSCASLVGEVVERVTREMALDAGDLSLEGTIYEKRDAEPCDCGYDAVLAKLAKEGL